MKYIHEVERVLAGESLYAVSKSAGLNSNTIRRELIKHPGYAAAKANGRLKPKHIPGRPLRDRNDANDARAIAEVIAGATTTATAQKYGLPVASLTKMVHVAHPDFSLQYRGKTKLEVLEEKMRKLALAKAKAERLAEMVS